MPSRPGLRARSRAITPADLLSGRTRRTSHPLAREQSGSRGSPKEVERYVGQMLYIFDRGDVLGAAQDEKVAIEWC